jgi:hypothetical protein
MYIARNKDTGTIRAGGRKSNRGKITEIRFVGGPSFRLAVVTRLGKGERVYSRKASRHAWNFATR